MIKRYAEMPMRQHRPEYGEPYVQQAKSNQIHNYRSGDDIVVRAVVPVGGRYAGNTRGLRCVLDTAHGNVGYRAVTEPDTQ